MTPDSLREAALEVRRIVKAVRGELEPTAVGPVLVSGMLGEQLARELGRDAEAGSVVLADSPTSGTAVAIRIIAADPSEQDSEFVRTADRLGVPVVLVQLWPQADWALPFVLTPFVVECRAGQGFPIGEIAARVFDAVEHGQDLAGRMPALRAAFAHAVVVRTVARAVLIGALGRRLGPSRPALVLEQARMLSQLRVIGGSGRLSPGLVAPLVAETASTLGSGLALRSLARTGRSMLPGPLVNAAVAGAGTWALARAIRLLEERA